MRRSRIFSRLLLGLLPRILQNRIPRKESDRTRAKRNANGCSGLFTSRSLQIGQFQKSILIFQTQREFHIIMWRTTTACISIIKNHPHVLGLAGMTADILRRTLKLLVTSFSNSRKPLPWRIWVSLEKEHLANIAYF